MVSLGIGGGVWAATGSPLAVPVAFAAGVLIDTDHALDFYNWYVRGDGRYLLLPFHAWEFSFVGLVLLLAVWHHPLFLAAVLAYLGHLIGDQVANSMHPMAYSALYRLAHRFDRELLTEQRLFSLSKVLEANIPFWGQIEPRLLRIASRLRNERS